MAGCLTYASQNKFFGEWVSGQPRTGTFKTSAGTQYSGEWKHTIDIVQTTAAVLNERKFVFKSENSVFIGERGSDDLGSMDRLDLSHYDHFRMLGFEINDQNYASYIAFKQFENPLGFFAEGVIFYRKNVCSWRSVVTDLSTKTGSFDAHCPFGVSITGEYTFNSGTGESYGSGQDTLGRNISFHLGPEGSSNREEIENVKI